MFITATTLHPLQRNKERKLKPNATRRIKGYFYETVKYP